MVMKNAILVSAKFPVYSNFFKHTQNGLLIHGAEFTAFICFTLLPLSLFVVRAWSLQFLKLVSDFKYGKC